MGESNVAVNAAIDEIFITLAMKSQIIENVNPTRKFKPINPPRKVATPFPPLKP